MLLFC